MVKWHQWLLMQNLLGQVEMHSPAIKLDCPKARSLLPYMSKAGVPIKIRQACKS
jgi:hypothetical protein